MTKKEIKERMEKRKRRSFRRNHPDFPLYFSAICLVLVILEPVYKRTGSKSGIKEATEGGGIGRK